MAANSEYTKGNTFGHVRQLCLVHFLGLQSPFTGWHQTTGQLALLSSSPPNIDTLRVCLQKSISHIGVPRQQWDGRIGTGTDSAILCLLAKAPTDRTERELVNTGAEKGFLCWVKVAHGFACSTGGGAPHRKPTTCAWWDVTEASLIDEFTIGLEKMEFSHDDAPHTFRSFAGGEAIRWVFGLRPRAAKKPVTYWVVINVSNQALAVINYVILGIEGHLLSCIFW